VNRTCLFVTFFLSATCLGQTTTQPPHSGEAQGVSPQERQGLVALYDATDGNHWKNRGGWLGTVGTECSWEGVRCEHGVHEPTTVNELDLSENNLRGLMPEAVGQLTNLKTLYIFGNSISGMLPGSLLKRWRTGELLVSAEPQLLTDVSGIDFGSSASSLLCEQHRVILRSDRSALLFTKRCRNKTPRDRTTFCEVKKGRTFPGEFENLGWLLEKNGFFTLRGDYYRNVTDGLFESTRATRGGKGYEVVDYAGAGRFDLWVIHRAIEGVASSTEWEKPTTQPSCPRWSDSRNNGQQEPDR